MYQLVRGYFCQKYRATRQTPQVLLHYFTTSTIHANVCTLKEQCLSFNISVIAAHCHQLGGRNVRAQKPCCGSISATNLVLSLPHLKDSDSVLNSYPLRLHFVDPDTNPVRHLSIDDSNFMRLLWLPMRFPHQSIRCCFTNTTLYKTSILSVLDFISRPR